jgi:hypothetical protein
MAAVPRVATAAVVFALVAAVSVPVIGARPLPVPPVPPVVTSSLMLVLLGGEVRGAAVAVSLPFPLSVPLPVLDGRARPGARARALPLVARSAPTAVAVATGRLGVTVAVVSDLGLEVGQQRRGLMSARRRAAAVGARTGAGAVGP